MLLPVLSPKFADAVFVNESRFSRRNPQAGPLSRSNITLAANVHGLRSILHKCRISSGKSFAPVRVGLIFACKAMLLPSNAFESPFQQVNYLCRKAFQQHSKDLPVLLGIDSITQ